MPFLFQWWIVKRCFWIRININWLTPATKVAWDVRFLGRGTNKQNVPITQKFLWPVHVQKQPAHHWRGLGARPRTLVNARTMHREANGPTELEGWPLTSEEAKASKKSRYLVRRPITPNNRWQGTPIHHTHTHSTYCSPLPHTHLGPVCSIP